MASSAAIGDSCPLAFLPTRVLQFSRMARFSVESSNLISEIRGLELFSARFLRANSIAASSNPSSGASSSMTPIARASLAATCRPEVIMSSAFSSPAIRGNRCVPPAPGIRPSCTSGRPTRALLTAMRNRQASAASSPPPRAVPCNAAMIGFGLASRACRTSGRKGARGGLPNSEMSAPAINVRPAQISTIA